MKAVYREIRLLTELHLREKRYLLINIMNIRNVGRMFLCAFGIILDAKKADH